MYQFLVLLLVHPTKAVGQNEMPFGRDTRVIQSNIVLDRALVPLQVGGIWGWNPSLLRCFLLPNNFGPCL